MTDIKITIMVEKENFNIGEEYSGECTVGNLCVALMCIEKTKQQIMKRINSAEMRIEITKES